MFLAATVLAIYDWRYVWPRTFRSRQEYLDHADDPEKANPALDDFDRYQTESLLILRNIFFSAARNHFVQREHSPGDRRHRIHEVSPLASPPTETPTHQQKSFAATPARRCDSACPGKDLSQGCRLPLKLRHAAGIIDRHDSVGPVHGRSCQHRYPESCSKKHRTVKRLGGSFTAGAGKRHPIHRLFPHESQVNPRDGGIAARTACRGCASNDGGVDGAGRRRAKDGERVAWQRVQASTWA